MFFSVDTLHFFDARQTQAKTWGFIAKSSNIFQKNLHDHDMNHLPHTPPKINMSPKKKPLPKENSLPVPSFCRCELLVFGGRSSQICAATRWCTAVPFWLSNLLLLRHLAFLNFGAGSGSPPRWLKSPVISGVTWVPYK